MEMGLMTLERCHMGIIEIARLGDCLPVPALLTVGAKQAGCVRRPGGLRDTAGAIVRSNVGRPG